MTAEQFLLKTGIEVGDLHVEKVISTLTPQQLNYATYLSLAGWAGFPILAAQTSREALKVHAFLTALIQTYPRDALQAAQPGTPLFFLVEYAAAFYYNGANYLGFGDSKFIPQIPKEELVALVASYPEISAKLAAVVDDIYSVDPPLLNLGWPPNNTTAYYEPSDFTKEEQIGVDALLAKAGIIQNNTIIVREETRYNVATFSIEVDEVGRNIGEFNGKPVVVTKGKFSDVLRKVNHWLSLAKGYAVNPIEAEALEHWVQDSDRLSKRTRA
jgi:dipeptidyl-peptidase-3